MSQADACEGQVLHDASGARLVAFVETSRCTRRVQSPKAVRSSSPPRHGVLHHRRHRGICTISATAVGDRAASNRAIHQQHCSSCSSTPSAT